MHRFIKTFLLWLLLAALPLQGFAAAMQLSCGPTKHAADPGMTAVVSVSHGHHDHAAPAHHHDADAHPATTPAPADHASGDGHAASSCSACSACCVGAIALPVNPIVTPVYSASVPAVPVFPVPLADFIPGGLERPPKTLTA